MIIFRLYLCTLFFTASASEHIQPPTPSISPRELTIQGPVTRKYKQSKRSGRIKTETLSATFVSGKKISITCSFKKDSQSYYGTIKQNGTKTAITEQSAQEDFNKLKKTYLQK